MLLGLSELINSPGGVISFQAEVDLSDLICGKAKPFPEPIIAVGKVRNTADVPVLAGTASTRLHGVCDRCACPFERDVTLPLEAVLVRHMDGSEFDHPWTFELSDGDFADLSEIVRTTFVLNMDTKLLCSEDCKGLCPVCGVNLNEEACRCKRAVDPRLAVLEQLLHEK